MTEGHDDRALLGGEGLMTVLTGYHFSKRNLIDACLQALPAAAGIPAELDK